MMTREEAIKLLKQYQGYEPMSPDGETLKHSFDLTDETVDALLTALRPVSRERVEKVWKSEWIDNGERDPNGVPKTFAISCKRCGSSAGTSWMRFCPACGAPMTDEAVEMVMKRMEKLHEDNGCS